MATLTTPKKGQSIPADWQDRFLVSLASYGNVTAAAKAARCSRDHAYDQRKGDADFAAAWDRALELGTSGLEDEARRRAFEGVTKPVYQGGVKVGTVKEYSDTLLIFLLKAHRPDKYRETVNQRLSGTVMTVPLTLEEWKAQATERRAAAQATLAQFEDEPDA